MTKPRVEHVATVYHLEMKLPEGYESIMLVGRNTAGLLMVGLDPDWTHKATREECSCLAEAVIHALFSELANRS